MSTVPQWSGREVRALREARRMSAWLLNATVSDYARKGSGRELWPQF